MNPNYANRAARRAVTLPEMLIALTITTLIVGTLGVFSRAVLDGVEETTSTSNANQEVRVILARIDRKVAESRRVVVASAALRLVQDTSAQLVLWERDGQTGDLNPGVMNYNELLIFTTPAGSSHSGHGLGAPVATNSSTSSALLWEIRPAATEVAVVDESDSSSLAIKLATYRGGQNIEPPTVLLADLGGIHFDTQEFTEPQTMGRLRQQNIRVAIHIQPVNQAPTLFCASMSRRYVSSN
jgi:hypothetical protein